VAAPLVVSTDLDVTVAGTNTLSTSGGLTVDPGKTVRKLDAGTWTISGAQTWGSGSTLEVGASPGGKVNLNAKLGTVKTGRPDSDPSTNVNVTLKIKEGTVKLGTDQGLVKLEMDPTLTGTQGLDLNGMAIRVLAASMTEDAVRLMLKNTVGTDGMYDTATIYSTISPYPAIPASQLGIGYSDQKWTTDTAQQYIAIRTVYKGDLDMSGAVNLNDLLVFQRHFGSGTGQTWDYGDLNYDGAVNLNDLLIFQRNFGKTGGPSAPEPGTLVLLALAGLSGAALWARRRRAR
jgi:hypothetical protein